MYLFTCDIAGKRPRPQPMDAPNDCSVLGFDGFDLARPTADSER